MNAAQRRSSLYRQVRNFLRGRFEPVEVRGDNGATFTGSPTVLHLQFSNISLTRHTFAVARCGEEPHLMQIDFELHPFNFERFMQAAEDHLQGGGLQIVTMFGFRTPNASAFAFKEFVTIDFPDWFWQQYHSIFPFPREKFAVLNNEDGGLFLTGFTFSVEL